jgi:hypothetical protein
MTPIIMWFLTRNVATETWRYYPDNRGIGWPAKTRSERTRRRLARKRGER